MVAALASLGSHNHITGTQARNSAHKATITCLLASTAIFSAHNAKWPDALSPLTGGEAAGARADASSKYHF